jgi:hypothetical protein
MPFREKADFPSRETSFYYSGNEKLAIMLPQMQNGARIEINILRHFPQNGCLPNRVTGRVARFLHVQNTKTGKYATKWPQNIPKGHKIY